MDLTARLLARTPPRPLVVALPGGRGVRLAVERVLRERGWDQASTPAEADLFVVCGSPSPALAEEVERVWSQLPSPRSRVDIHAAGAVVEELDRARGRLADPEHRRVDAGDTQRGHDMDGSHVDLRGGEDAHGSHDELRDGGHDMHMMHGGAVAGLPMADRGADRDGLTLDVLHVSLGPVLADWPAGLAVRVALQGDVVQSAQVGVVGWTGSPWNGPPAVAALDSIGRLLMVCGATTVARTARRLRDQADGGVVDDAGLRRFTRGLRRSRTLRWATDGIGRLDDSLGELAGDATDRWYRWLDLAEGAPPAGDPDRRARAAVEVLPGLLEGLELAAARVLVASLDPDLDALVAPREAAR